MVDSRAATMGNRGDHAPASGVAFLIPPLRLPGDFFHAGSHRLTVLHPRGFKQARKTILSDGRVVTEDIGGYFRPEELFFDTIEDIDRFLAAGINAHHAVVTGRVVRLTSDSTDERQTVHRTSANIADIPQRLISIDIDGAPCPEHLEWHEEPDEVVDHLVRAILPAVFHRVSYCWFWSASHGTRDKIFRGGLNASEVRVRILFLADRDMTAREMAIWLRDVGGIDHSMFQAERLNFVCRPYLKYAGLDPLEGLRLHGLVLKSIAEVSAPAQIRLDERPPLFVTRSHHGDRRDPRSFHDFRVNDHAIKNLDRWVPALPLHNLRKVAGTYKCVAHWRPSSSGRPLQQRQGTVSINERGIMDFGLADGSKAGLTPLRFIMKALGCNYLQAQDWLCSALGIDAPEPLPPWNPSKDCEA